MSDNVELNHLSEDEIEVDNVEQKAIKCKQSSVELFDEFSELLATLDTLDTTFSEKEKQFEKDKKEYYSQRKNIIKQQDLSLKKFGKSFKHDIVRATKPRKTGNSGKGGLMKQSIVPEKLRNYLELAEDVLMSRPELTKLLNKKFTEDKFRDGKIVKISNKKAAKALGCEVNHVIEFNQFQGFIAKFYNDEKVVALSV